MFVGEIMSNEVVTITPGDNLHYAVKLMLKHNIRHIPVVSPKNKNKMVGLISERDVGMSLTFPNEGDDFQWKPKLIKEIMEKNVSSVTSKTLVQDAARLIYRLKIGALPVIDNKKLTGIITYQDILGVFIEMMDMLQKSSRIDVKVKSAKEAEKVKSFLEKKGCEIIGIGLFSARKNEEVYSFRINYQATQPLADHLEKSGFMVVEHFC